MMPRYPYLKRKLSRGAGISTSPALIKRTKRVTFKRRSPALQNILGVETKFVDATRSALALTAPTNATGGEITPDGGITGCLSAPAQGDGPSARDGSRIMIKSILVRGIISIPLQADQTDPDITPIYFVALVKDKQTNGATLNSEDVFNNPAAVASHSVVPNRNMSFTKRFKVLQVWTFQVPPVITCTNDQATVTMAQSGAHTPFTISHTFKKNLPVQFTTGSTTADVANVIDNSLHIIAFTSGTGMAPTISYNSRMHFVG